MASKSPGLASREITEGSRRSTARAEVHVDMSSSRPFIRADVKAAKILDKGYSFRRVVVGSARVTVGLTVVRTRL
jgi:hypothetical protein